MSYNDLSSLNQNIINQRALQNTQEGNNANVQNSVSSEVKKIDKKKLAVGVAAGIGITALVVGGILYNKKINSEAVKELAEHIDFKEAKSLDEAIEFGKQCLGVKKYKGFKEADLDVLNWVNEGLVNVNNKAKGKAIMPNAVKYVKTINSEIGKGTTSVNGLGTVKIAKMGIEELKKDVTELSEKLFGVSKEEIGDVTFGQARNFLANMVKYDKSAREIFEKMGYTINIDKFHEIYHEMGHLQHMHSISSDLFYQLTSYNLSKTKL